MNADISLARFVIPTPRTQLYQRGNTKVIYPCLASIRLSAAYDPPLILWADWPVGSRYIIVFLTTLIDNYNIGKAQSDVDGWMILPNNFPLIRSAFISQSFGATSLTRCAIGFAPPRLMSQTEKCAPHDNAFHFPICKRTFFRLLFCRQFYWSFNTGTCGSPIWMLYIVDLAVDVVTLIILPCVDSGLLRITLHFRVDERKHRPDLTSTPRGQSPPYQIYRSHSWTVYVFYNRSF